MRREGPALDGEGEVAEPPLLALHPQPLEDGQAVLAAGLLHGPGLGIPAGEGNSSV